MQSGGSYLQGYNCQLAVDSDHQVIVVVGRGPEKAVRDTETTKNLEKVDA